MKERKERSRAIHVISLGSYARPGQAAEDVAGGHTDSLSGGTDTATLGIPEDLSEWQRIG